MRISYSSLDGSQQLAYIRVLLYSLIHIKSRSYLSLSQKVNSTIGFIKYQSIALSYQLFIQVYLWLKYLLFFFKYFLLNNRLSRCYIIKNSNHINQFRWKCLFCVCYKSTTGSYQANRWTFKSDWEACVWSDLWNRWKWTTLEFSC